CFGMNRRNRALDLIGPWPPHPKGTFDEPNTLLDLGPIPLAPILILKKHQIAFVADACLAPRVVEQHERQEAYGLSLARKERGQGEESRGADRGGRGARASWPGNLR